MNKNTKPIKYILYARKSSESEDRQVLSIDSQIDELKRIATRENLHIVDVLTESRSAKTLGRPVFKQVIEKIMRGEANGILCWKLDRLARNFMDGGNIIEVLQQGTLRHIVTHDHNYFPQDNVLLMAVEFGMANQYSRDLAVNVGRGLRRKAEMGWIPCRPPIGYLNSRINIRGSNNIFKDPDRYDLVRKMWDLMLTGSYNACQVLDIANNQWGLNTRRGHKLCKGNIYRLFTNPFYYGEFEWPRTSDNWYKGAHEPMITIEEYDRVQMLLGRKGRPRPKRHEFAFIGLIKCKECAASVTAEEKNKLQKNGNKHHYIYYRCTKRKNPNCTQKTIEENKLCDQVVEKLDSLKIPDEFHQWALKWLEKDMEKDGAMQQEIISAHRKTHDDVVKRLNRYIEMRANEELTEEEFREKKAEALKEKGRLDVLLNGADNRMAKGIQDMKDGLKFVKRAEEKFKNGTLQERRQIFSALGSNFFLEYKKLLIDMEESLIPMQKVAEKVQSIIRRLEPLKNVDVQRDLEQIYTRSTVVCGQGELNPFLRLGKAA